MKSILLWICMASVNNQDLQNLLQKPIYLSPQSSSVRGQKTNNIITISFWTLIQTQQQEFQINIFKFFNLKSSGQKDLSLPECPYSQNYLKSHPELAKLEFIKDNSNCIQTNHTEGIMSFDIVLQKEQLEGILIYPKDQQLQSQNIPLKINKWINIQIALDYNQKKGLLFTWTDFESNKYLLEIGNSSFKFEQDYQVYFSNNEDKEGIYGILYDFNFYENYFSKGLLYLYNFNEKTLEQNDLNLDIRFSELKQKDEIKIKNDSYSGEILDQKNGLIVNENFNFQIGQAFNNLSDTLVFSPTFYLTFEIEGDNFQFVLFEGVWNDNKIELKLQQKEGQRIYYILVNNDILLEHSNNKNFNAMSFFTMNNLSQVYISFDDDFVISKKFESGSIREYSWRILRNEANQHKIKLYRIVVLQTILPLIYKIEQIKSNCNIPLVPSLLKQKKCLNCMNTVLNEDLDCVDFCQKSEKNENGVCVKCLDEKCSEIQYPQLMVKRKDSEEFIVSFSQPLFESNEKELLSSLSLEIEGYKNEKDYIYTQEMLSDKETILNFDFKKPIKNSQLLISIPQNEQQKFHTINREQLSMNDFKMDITSTPLHSNILVGIFWTLVALGLFLGFYQFKYSIQNYSFKRLYYCFIKIQLISLLIFCSNKYPQNFNEFTSKIFKYTIRFLGTHFIRSQNSLNDLGNSDLSISQNFLDNMFFIIVIQILLIFVYFLAYLVRIIIKIRYFSVKTRDRILKIIDTYEFSFLYVIFTLLTPTIYCFVVISLKHFNTNKWISFVVSLIYIAIFALFLFIYIIVYTKQKGFRYYSEFKNKFQFLFTGYKDTSLSHLYEVVQLVLLILIGIVFGGLYKNQNTMITFLVFLTILQSLMIMLIKPHLSSSEQFFQIIDKISFTITLLLISLLEMYQDHQFLSKIIGWICIGILGIQLLIDFLWSFFISLKNIKNLSKSQDTINLGSHPFQKLGSKDDNLYSSDSLDNEKQGMFRSLKGRMRKQEKDQNETLDIGNKSSFIQEKITKREVSNDLEEYKSGSGSQHDSYVSKHSIEQIKQLFYQIR